MSATPRGLQVAVAAGFGAVVDRFEVGTGTGWVGVMASGAGRADTAAPVDGPAAEAPGVGNALGAGLDVASGAVAAAKR